MAQLFEMVVVSGWSASLDDTDNNINGTPSSEQLSSGADMSSDDNNSMMPEVVEDVAGQLLITAGFQLANASHILEMQEGDNGQVTIDMPPRQQVPARLPPALVQLSKAIWTISLLTLVFDIRAALYKPARGVVFGHNKIVYYLVLSAIFALGLGEATTAFWLSRPNGGSLHRLSFGRAVLCASFLPLVAVCSIAGYGLIQD